MASIRTKIPPATPDPAKLFPGKFPKGNTVGGGGEDPDKPKDGTPGKSHLAEGMSCFISLTGWLANLCYALELIRCPKCGNRHKGDCEVGHCDKCKRPHRLPCHYCKKCGKRGSHTTGQCRKAGNGGVHKAPVFRRGANIASYGGNIFDMSQIGDADTAWAFGKAVSGGMAGRGTSGRGASGRGASGRGGRGRGLGRGRGRDHVGCFRRPAVDRHQDDHKNSNNNNNNNEDEGNESSDQPMDESGPGDGVQQ
jgi:hypothetical protein